MVSQPTMRRIPGLPFCLVGLTAVILSFAACGQGEGGRCQINSDCSSGLECSDTSGNGVCRVKGAVVASDASIVKDSGDNVSVASGPEVGTDSGVAPESDAETSEAGSID